MTVTLLTATSLAASLAVLLYSFLTSRRMDQRAAALMKPRAVDEDSTQRATGRTATSKLFNAVPGMFRLVGLGDQKMQRRLKIIGQMRRAGMPQSHAMRFAVAKLLSPLLLLPVCLAGSWCHDRD